MSIFSLQTKKHLVGWSFGIAFLIDALILFSAFGIRTEKFFVATVSIENFLGSIFSLLGLDKNNFTQGLFVFLLVFLVFVLNILLLTALIYLILFPIRHFSKPKS